MLMASNIIIGFLPGTGARCVKAYMQGIGGSILKREGQLYKLVIQDPHNLSHLHLSKFVIIYVNFHLLNFEFLIRKLILFFLSMKIVIQNFQMVIFRLNHKRIILVKEFNYNAITIVGLSK